MKRVAADDVRFLLHIHERMSESLTELSKWRLRIRSSLYCRCFCSVDANFQAWSLPPFEGDPYYRRCGFFTLNYSYLCRLQLVTLDQELCIFWCFDNFDLDDHGLLDIRWVRWRKTPGVWDTCGDRCSCWKNGSYYWHTGWYNPPHQEILQVIHILQLRVCSTSSFSLNCSLQRDSWSNPSISICIVLAALLYFCRWYLIYFYIGYIVLPKSHNLIDQRFIDFSALILFVSNGDYCDIFCYTALCTLWNITLIL